MHCLEFHCTAPRYKDTDPLHRDCACAQAATPQRRCLGVQTPPPLHRDSVCVQTAAAQRQCLCPNSRCTETLYVYKPLNRDSVCVQTTTSFELLQAPLGSTQPVEKSTGQHVSTMHRRRGTPLAYRRAGPGRWGCQPGYALSSSAPSPLRHRPLSLHSRLSATRRAASSGETVAPLSLLHPELPELKKKATNNRGRGAAHRKV